MEAENTESETVPDSFPLPRLDGFLENISLLSSIDMGDEEDSSNKISLMTVHSAKGLEFPYVFVVGMEENLFPSGGMLASPQDIEEERRLFYVALTRAEKVVYLSFAQERMRNGQHQSNSVSRFMKEIDSDCLDRPVSDEDGAASFRGGFGGGAWRSGSYAYGGSAGSGKSSSSSSYGSGYSYGASGKVSYEKRGSSPYSSGRSPAASNPARSLASPSLRNSGSASVRTAHSAPVGTVPQYSEADFTPEPMGSFRIGQRIEHNRFGPGLILDLSGTAPDIKAKISFDAFPQPKIILLKYAKMRAEKN